MPYLAGARVQQGYGSGNLFSSISKSVLLLVKKGAKTLRKQVLQSGVDFACDTNDKPPQRGGAVLFPTLERVEMACRFPEGLILRRFSFGQLFSFFITAVQCAVTCGQHS